ncbi:hypothetical protein LJC58_00755 [Lachnospiraceae bacterium OttesenSCG-928-D06]|nr:hypothetical protein [Lachnospiraceae bacterium OttesenSCG-928-D06]
MDFFGKVSETITSKSKNVAKKARDIVEISSLNGQITAQEDKIRQIFLELGKSVYEQEIKADPETAEKCSEVEAAYGEIKRLEKEIVLLKGIKKCNECGFNVAAESAFCPECGRMFEKEESREESSEEDPSYEEMEKPKKVIDVLVHSSFGDMDVAVESAICSQCEMELEEGAVYCPGCGKKI